ARCSAVALVADSRAAIPSMNIQLLMNLRDIFGEGDRMTSDDILTGLIKIEDAPWSDMNGAGRELTPRGLAQRLSNYQIKSCNIRIGSIVVKGYKREDLNDAWTRYLGVADAQPEFEKGKLIEEEEGKGRSLGVATQEP